MAATCKSEGCTFPVFGGGYCKYHQGDRNKVKKEKKDRGLFQRDKVEEPNIFEKDKAFYQEIWDEREHRCYETGIYLGNSISTLFFHHILPKAKYPQYRHEKWNIVLLSADAHYQVETKIDRCPKVNQLTKELKQQYG